MNVITFSKEFIIVTKYPFHASGAGLIRFVNSGAACMRVSLPTMPPNTSREWVGPVLALVLCLTAAALVWYGLENSSIAIPAQPDQSSSTDRHPRRSYAGVLHLKTDLARPRLVAACEFLLNSNRPITTRNRINGAQTSAITAPASN